MLRAVMRMAELRPKSASLFTKKKCTNKCLSDGDTIKLKNKEYGRWVSSEDGVLLARNSSDGDEKVFTVFLNQKSKQC